MGKILIHGDVFGFLKATIELPTIKTPYCDFPEYMRREVMHKLDIRKKWMGCWMYEGAHDARSGEPQYTNKDTKREKGIAYKPQHIYFKNRIAIEFVDISNMPRRKNGMCDWNVLHLCGNKDCLNPSHFLICLDHHEMRDKDELRDKYLAPGTYYVP